MKKLRSKTSDPFKRQPAGWFNYYNRWDRAFSKRSYTRSNFSCCRPHVPESQKRSRAGSMTITKRAMLSRGVSVIRKKTLIINLPGSKRQWKSLSLSLISCHNRLDLRKTQKIAEETKRGDNVWIYHRSSYRWKRQQVILFTFILGLLAARWILYRKSDATRIFWDGIFTMPLVLPTVAGFSCLYFRIIWTSRKIIWKLSWDQDCIFMGATILAAVVMSFPLMYRSARGAWNRLMKIWSCGKNTWNMSGIFELWSQCIARWIISGGGLYLEDLHSSNSNDCWNIPGRIRTLPLAVYSEVAAAEIWMQHISMYLWSWSFVLHRSSHEYLPHHGKKKQEA